MARAVVNGALLLPVNTWTLRRLTKQMHAVFHVVGQLDVHVATFATIAFHGTTLRGVNRRVQRLPVVGKRLVGATIFPDRVVHLLITGGLFGHLN